MDREIRELQNILIIDPDNELLLDRLIRLYERAGLKKESLILRSKRGEEFYIYFGNPYKPDAIWPTEDCLYVHRNKKVGEDGPIIFAFPTKWDSYKNRFVIEEDYYDSYLESKIEDELEFGEGIYLISGSGIVHSYQCFDYQNRPPGVKDYKVLLKLSISDITAYNYGIEEIEHYENAPLPEGTIRAIFKDVGEPPVEIQSSRSIDDIKRLLRCEYFGLVRAGKNIFMVIKDYDLQDKNEEDINFIISEKTIYGPVLIIKIMPPSEIDFSIYHWPWNEIYQQAVDDDGSIPSGSDFANLTTEEVGAILNFFKESNERY